MWYNAIMAGLLRSPLHGLMGKGMAVVTVTGRKSGRAISTPVNVLRDGGTLWVTSLRGRTWWRNLCGGAPVSVRLAGRDLKGRGEAIVEPRAVAGGLAAYFQKAPGYARYFNVAFDESGRPDPDDCARAAGERVLVRIDLA